MRLYDAALADGERSGLPDDAVRHDNLADVVQPRSQLNLARFRLRQSGLDRKHRSPRADTVRMKAAVLFAQLDGQSHLFEELGLRTGQLSKLVLQ